MEKPDPNTYTCGKFILWLEVWKTADEARVVPSSQRIEGKRPMRPG
jgi:hypothetical protein